ncbi:hypothetical protein CC79DRAFT_1359461 [Sarocladium strictum]
MAAPAVCQTCNRQFSKLEHLKRHERSHTRVRPYQCSICHKSYARSDVLYRHCRNHGPDAVKKMAERSKGRESRPRRITSPQGPLEDQQLDTVSLNGSSGSQQDPNGSQGLPEAAAEWNIIVGPAAQQLSPDASNQSSGSWTHVDSNGVADIRNNPDNLDPVILDRVPDRSAEGHGDAIYARSMGDSYQHDSATMGTAQTHRNVPDSAATQPQSANIGLSAISSSERAPMVLAQRSPLLASNATGHQPSTGMNHAFSQAQQMDTPMILAAASQFSLPHDDWWLSFDDFDILSVVSPPSAASDVPAETTTNRNGSAINPFTSADPPVASGTSHEGTQTPLRKQLPRLQHVWARRSGVATKPMASLWHALSTGDGLFGNLEEGPGIDDSRVRRYRTLDPETRQQACSFFQSILGSNSNSVAPTVPAPETVEIAYEQYWIHHHNVAPIIHAPTFFAKKAPLDVVVTMCTIGFSVMGTPELHRLVDKSCPVILKRVSELLQNVDNRGTIKLTDHLETLVACVLALNLGAINSDREGFKDIEPMFAALFARLLNRAQQDGLFSADKLPPSLKELKSLPTEGKRWRAWGSVESVKRLILSLIQLDSWFAFFFATEPTLQVEAVFVMPVCESELFEANSLEKWCEIRPDFHQMDYPVISASYSETPTIARSYDMIYTLLMILQLRFSAASLVVERATQNGDSPLSSPPWKLFGRDIRTKGLVGLTVDLARAANPKDRNFEMNSAVSWHVLCMSLSANIRLLETAAGRSGPEAASMAMKEVSAWAGTSTARRAALHAVQIFNLLFKRRFCDPVKLHTIISLFQASLVLGFYICARKHPDSPQVFDVYEPIDWVGIGSFGLTDEEASLDSLPSWVMQLPETQYIIQEQTLAFGDFIVTSGITEARKCWLQFASLMMGLGRWKARTFSRILHVMCDNLLEGESVGGSKDGE